VCNLHNRFHWSKLHPHFANNNALFLHEKAHVYYNFGNPDDQEWLVKEILAHKWDRDMLSF
jgi:hypothetical protein